MAEVDNNNGNNNDGTSCHNSPRYLPHITRT